MALTQSSVFYNDDKNFGFNPEDDDPNVRDSFLDKICYYNTLSAEAYKELCEVPHGKAQPCGKGKIGDIYRALKKFFIILRGVKKYADKYINQTLNAVKNLQGEITATIKEIVAVLKTLVHRAREWVLKKIKKGIEDLIDKVLIPQTVEPKKALLSKIINEIFCKFSDIINGLFNLVGDFLYNLIGQVINVPFCAAESFVNALLSKVLNDIDNALKPFFDEINKVLAPVSKIMGSVFQVIDFILGFENFLCEKPLCNDELKEFAAGPWGKPQNSKTDNWSNFNFSSTIGKGANQLMDDFFGKGKGGSYVSPGGCYTGDFNCGINVQFFGGGGSGAVGAAVVNKIGQVVGVNLFYGGSGYTSPPFVSFIDPGGCGSYASGFPNINDNGEVEDVVIVSPGIGYTDTFPLPPVITNFVGTPTSVEVEKNILFSWQTENATSVSLSSKEYPLIGYSNLPTNGNQSIGISSSNIKFSTGESSKIVTYTLTASKDVPGWERIETSKDFNVEVYLPGSIPADPVPSTSSSLTPTILTFDANPIIASVGNVIKFNWQTKDTTFVGLGLSIGPGIVTSLYDNLIANGSASIVIPNNLVFPTDGSNIINTYVLKATNIKAPVGKNTDTKYVKVEIVSPKSLLPNWVPPSKTPKTTSTGLINITGTTSDNPGGNNGENNSGSLESLGNKGTYIPTTGVGNTTDGNFGGENNTGGGDTSLDNPSKFLPIGGGGGQSDGGGANIDPAGSSPTTGTTGIITNIDILTTFPPSGTTTTGTNQTATTGIGTGGVGVGVTEGKTGSSSGNIEVISQIYSVEIVNTGTGYKPDDKVEIVGGNNGAELSIETTPSGQIVNIKVISGGYGFVSIPDIRINSIDGLGAKFRPILRFIPAAKFNQKELNRIGTDKLLRVVDCVLR